MANEVEVLVGDRNGRILGEVEWPLEAVSWRLNGVGRAGLAAPSAGSGSSKTTEEFLRFGNTVLISFDNGLPKWGGIMDPGRDWKGKTIKVALYSGETLLGFRQTDRGRYFSSATVGYIFEQLILGAKQVWPAKLMVGQVWYGGDGHWPEYHFDNLLEIIQKSLCGRLSDADFEVTAEAANGYITFTANLYERKGIDRPGVVLQEDTNMGEMRLLEQGPIVNWWDLAGEGTGWGDDRIYAQRYDLDSISRYGLRQGSKVFPDISVQSTLDAAADELLAQTKEPANKWDLDVLDLGSALFADYGVGDSVRLVAPSFGFNRGAAVEVARGSDGMVKVESREFSPAGGRCRLIVEEEN